MNSHEKYVIRVGVQIKEALLKLNHVGRDGILFIIDEEDRLVGSLTDGDVRRGLIKGLEVKDTVEKFYQANPKFISKGDYTLESIIKLREGQFNLIPVLDEDRRIIRIINFTNLKSYLPVDAVIMAGGRGSRLKPMTDEVPKPLLKVGEKPIMEHALNHLMKFGVDDFWFSVRYKGEQIESFFGDGSERSVRIEYVWEDEPLGTIGAVSKIKSFKHENILVTNSDILTTLDYEDFYLNFINSGADMAVATIPYTVNVPYAVMETNKDHVVSFKEKPTYTYYSNAGIYLLKKSIIESIPKDTFYNSTDLMQDLIDRGLKLVSYPVRNYWLDIGKPEDFEKAQSDIGHLL